MMEPDAGSGSGEETPGLPVTSRFRPRSAPYRLALAILGLWLAAVLPAPLAPGQALAQEATPVVLTAEEIVFDERRQILTAKGEVTFSQEERRLLADEVRYDIEADEVTATGSIVLIDPDGHAAFADSFTLSGDLKDGFVDHVGVIFSDWSRLVAIRASRTEGEVTTLEKAVYSPCEICEDEAGDPLWQIRAERVVHDRRTRTVSYRNAALEIFGLPVFFTPFFYHPDPTVDRRTGFLAPRFGSDTELGFTLETPFFIELAENRDLTVAPTFISKGEVLLDLEYRELQSFGLTEIGGAVTRTDEAGKRGQPQRGKEVRGHVEANGRYSLNERHQAGFDIAWASDNTFLDRYDLGDDDVLENRVFLDRFDGRDFFSLNGYAFQSLREGDDQDEIPLALPLAEGHMVRDGAPLGGQWRFDANILALTRDEGLNTQRLSGEAAWELPLVGPIGDLIRLRAGLRGDLYRTDGDPRTRGGAGDTDLEARVVPSLHGRWSWPLVAETGRWQHLLAPTATATWIGRNVNDDGIPNEDSLVFEFDETNLFERSRFTGLDRVESGGKVAYGLRFQSQGPGARRIAGVLGQSLRRGGDELFPDGSGLEDSLSDVVGRIDFRPGPLLDVTYRFRVDKDDLSFRRNDLRVGFGPERLRFDIQLLELSEDLVDEELREREELVAGVRLQALDSLAVGFQTRRDLSEEAPVANSVGLVYTNPCLVIVAGLERSFTAKGELEDETRIAFRVSFRGLGDVEATSELF